MSDKLQFVDPLRYEVSTTCVSGWAEHPSPLIDCLIHPLTQVVLTSPPVAFDKLKFVGHPHADGFEIRQRFFEP